MSDESTTDYAADFIAFCAELRHGTFLQDAGAGLEELAEAVSQTGRKGVLTIAFEIRPAGQGMRGQVVIKDSITNKPPKAENAETGFYVLEEGKLTRRDPRQPSLPFVEGEIDG